MIRMVFGGIGDATKGRSNTPWELVQVLAGQCRNAFGNQMEIKELLLEGSVEEMLAILKTSLESEQPVVVLMIGLRTGAVGLEFGKFALAIDEHQFDGFISGSPEAEKMGEIDVYEPSINLGSLAERARTSGVPARTSVHTETYRANNLYYHTLIWANEQEPPARVAMVHLPYLDVHAAEHYGRTNSAVSSMSLELATKGLRVTVDALMPGNQPE